MFIILLNIIFVGSTDMAEMPLRWNKLFCNLNRNNNLFHVRCGQSFFDFGQNILLLFFMNGSSCNCESNGSFIVKFMLKSLTQLP